MHDGWRGRTSPCETSNMAAMVRSPRQRPSIGKLRAVTSKRHFCHLALCERQKAVGSPSSWIGKSRVNRWSSPAETRPRPQLRTVVGFDGGYGPRGSEQVSSSCLYPTHAPQSPRQPYLDAQGSNSRVVAQGQSTYRLFNRSFSRVGSSRAPPVVRICFSVSRLA